MLIADHHLQDDIFELGTVTIDPAHVFRAEVSKVLAELADDFQGPSQYIVVLFDCGSIWEKMLSGIEKHLSLLLVVPSILEHSGNHIDICQHEI